MKLLRTPCLGLATAAVLLMGGAGCTIRYSQTLVGTIDPVEGRPITNSNSGFELGLSPAGITFSEPTETDELLDLPCDVALAQADYRAMFLSFYISLIFPKTEAVAYCIR
jgi:hypothetical protein